MMYRFLGRVAVLLGSMGYVTGAAALKAGDIGVRLGASYPYQGLKDDTSTLSIAPKDAADLSEVGYKDMTERHVTPTLGLVYMFSDNLGTELQMGWPATHTASLAMPEGGQAQQFSAKRWTPSLTLQWYPLGNSEGLFRPYLGAGVQYAMFSDLTGSTLKYPEQKLDTKAAYWGESTTTLTPLKSPAQINFVALAGADFQLDPNWALNVSAQYRPLSTETTFEAVRSGQYTTAPTLDEKGAITAAAKTSTVTRSQNVTVKTEEHPMVYTVGVTYTF